MFLAFAGLVLALIAGVVVGQRIASGGANGDVRDSVQAATMTPPTTTGSGPDPDQTRTPEPYIEHVIQEGEFVITIASRYGIDTDDIIAANPGLDPRFISVGDVLIIPISGALFEPTPDESR